MQTPIKLVLQDLELRSLLPQRLQVSSTNPKSFSDEPPETSSPLIHFFHSLFRVLLESSGMAIDLGDFHLDSIDELQKEQPVASTSRSRDRKDSSQFKDEDDAASIRPPSFAEVS